MSIQININEITEPDYDGNDETIKEVTVEIDNVRIKEFYSYPQTTENATIESEVEADLTAKGYSW